MKFLVCCVVAAVVVLSSSVVEAGCPGGRCSVRGRAVRTVQPMRSIRYVVGGKVRHIQMPRLKGVCSNGRCSN